MERALEAERVTRRFSAVDMLSGVGGELFVLVRCRSRKGVLVKGLVEACQKQMCLKVFLYNGGLPEAVVQRYVSGMVACQKLYDWDEAK